MLLRRLGAAIAAIAVLGATWTPVSAVSPAGAFDRSFGGTGYVKVPTATAPRGLPTGGVAQAPSGRIYAATLRFPTPPADQSWSDYAWIEIVAYTPAGSLDPAFNGGRPLAAVRGSDECCALYGPWVTSTGGVEIGVLTYHGIVVKRFTASGRPDTRYSEDGQAALGWDILGPMTRLPGGSVRATQGGSGYYTTLLGLTPAGDPDLRLGPGGERNIPMPWVSELMADRYGRMFAVQIDPEGDRVRAMRLSSSGATDAGWGEAGIATVAVAGLTNRSGDHVAAIADTGHVYVGVNVRDAVTGQARPAVVRFTPAGEPDASWGPGGVAVVPAPSAAGRMEALAVDAAGRVLVSFVDRDTTLAPYLARLLPSGTADPTFGSAGRWRVAGLVVALVAVGDRFLTLSRTGQGDVFVARRVG